MSEAKIKEVTDVPMSQAEAEADIRRVFDDQLKDFIQHCCVYNDNGDMVMKRAKVKSWFGITDE